MTSCLQCVVIKLYICYIFLKIKGFQTILDKLNDIKQKVIKRDDEKVTILLIIGGGNGTDYLVYCLVNGKQTLINGKYDPRYNIKENMAINDVVDIDINSKGIYEVNFYIIENPEDAKINNNQIENSYKFTIIKEQCQ